MKAVEATAYGAPDVLRVVEIAAPTIGAGDVLVRVHAAAVTAADVRIRAAKFPKGFSAFARLAFGITKPRNKVLGSTFSGVVEQVGAEVTEYAPGDEVCGMTGVRMGTYAEYVAVNSKKSIAKKPANVRHEDAAGMLFGGTAALYFLRDKASVQAGETVCVNGASGAVGTNAVQLARYFGATVTGVTRGGHAALVKRLGASDVIDYTQQNLLESGRAFDVVLDTVGNLSPADSSTLLTKSGRLLLMVASLGQMITSRGRVMTGTATEKRQDIEFLLSLMADGTMQTVIDRTYPLDEVAAAHTYVESGSKTGNVLLVQSQAAA